MGRCRKCGTYISNNYLFCYRCNKTSKTYKDRKGYVKFKGSNRSLQRHVKSKQIGRKLRKEEVVHHKSKNRSDNRMSNLKLYKNQSEHMKKEHSKKKGFFRRLFG